MTTDLDECVQGYFDALNRIDRQAYLACFTPDAVVRDPYGGPVFQGETGLNKFFDGMERTWSNFQMTPDGAYKSGNRVAVPWRTTATSTSGKTANFAGVNVFELSEQGRIQSLEGYWNFRAMLAQIKD